MSRPTQKTIAKMTGLAVTTVSRALKGDVKIAQATRDKVAQVAEEIGYVPDRAARRLRTGRTHVLSLVLNPHDEILGFGNSMISGLTQALRGSDYHLTIFPCFDGDDDVDVVRHIVRNELSDGVLISRMRVFDARVKYLLEQSFPFVSHGRTDLSQPHAYVDFDNEAFAFLAVHRLAQKGCRRLAIVLPSAEFTFHQHLRYGFMRAVSELGLSYVLPEGIDLESDAGAIEHWASELVQLGDEAGPVDGFVCPGEASYLAIATGLRAVGQRVGQDFHAVVKCNTSLLNRMDPHIDCIFEDVAAAGCRMGESLLDQLRVEHIAPRQEVIMPQVSE